MVKCVVNHVNDDDDDDDTNKEKKDCIFNKNFNVKLFVSFIIKLSMN